MSGLYARPGPLWPGAGGRTFGVDGVPAGATVVVRRRQSISRPGESEPVLGPWSGALEHEVEGVGLDRMTSTVLDGDSGDTTLQTSTLYAPTGGDIRQGDRVLFPTGVLVEVEGIPSREPNMLNGWAPPMTVSVKVTHG